MNLWDDIFNRMNDDEWAWWPFSFLKPAKHLAMTSRLVLCGAILYGVPLGMFVNLFLAAGESSLAKYPFLFPAGFSLALFVLHRLTLARAWNRRAERLTILAEARSEAVD